MPNLSGTVGKINFLDIPLEYTNQVLTPRLETEALVVGTARYFGMRKSPDCIIDVGTGSGAIIISLHSRFPNAKLFAVDISETALQVAQKNAKSNKVIVDFRHGNLLDTFFHTKDAVISNQIGIPNGNTEINDEGMKNITLIIANLPYIGKHEEVGEDVKIEDPAIALYGGGELGFDTIQQLLEQVKDLVTDTNHIFVALEFGHTQLPLVEAWAKQQKLLIESWNDYSGITRFSIIDYGN